MRRWFILGVLGLGVLASCSVKEDRSDCPCWLTVYAPENARLNAWFGDKQICRNHRGTIHDEKFPRGMVEITAYKGEFTANLNEPMDSLYAGRMVINTASETRTETIRLNKQFATVDVEFSSIDEPLNPNAWLFTGTVCGADERTLEPKEGLFRVQPEVLADGTFRANVPRQKDDSLRLELLDNGVLVDDIPIGQLIRKAGFDWNQESLGDIHIQADIPSHTFRITILEWGVAICETIII